MYYSLQAIVTHLQEKIHGEEIEKKRVACLKKGHTYEKRKLVFREKKIVTDTSNFFYCITAKNFT